MAVLKREEILERLLRRTWECLPPVLSEDCCDETDMEGLAEIADTVRAALGEPPPEEWVPFMRLKRPDDSQ